VSRPPLRSKSSATRWPSDSHGSTAPKPYRRCEIFSALVIERPGTLKERFFAIVNPAAGGGRSAKLAGPALARLRERSMLVDVVETPGPGGAIQIAREAYVQGYRRFIAVGGDGTAHEILNGVFLSRSGSERISLGFLPLGTGNSFLRDFTDEGAEASLKALLAGRKRAVDLIRLSHANGEIY